MSAGTKSVNGHSIVSEQDLTTIADKELHSCTDCDLSAYGIKPFVGVECSH